MTKKILTKDNINISGIQTINISIDNKTNKIKEIPGTQMEYNCDLLLIAMGFVSHEKNIFQQLAVEMNHTEILISWKFWKSENVVWKCTNTINTRVFLPKLP